MRGYKNADEGLQKGFTDLEQEGNFIVPGRHAAVNGASVFTISSGGPLHLSPCMISKGNRDTRPSSEKKKGQPKTH